MSDCIFCKIAAGEIPSNKVYEDDRIIAFHDINPMAPVHVLFVPKEHISSANEINEDNCDIVGHIFSKIPAVAKELGLENGYRVVTNCGKEGCQSVMHLHFHLLGGKQLGVGMA
ncbi:MAG: histidine triad nucleotide-binding protein [Ruminococcus sp.]|uniref:histidine triad nucleotide-binding protein n=1 Tax=Ruminococcus sp. TaxID=41978 RepID=UPI002873E506|nr:histidine triad nucleotide-binding protein [Ruminococcus sp.]MBQ3285966.1 histidine triad nucleotide-binding protein [Ruminococcus sp.]